MHAPIRLSPNAVRLLCPPRTSSHNLRTAAAEGPAVRKVHSTNVIVARSAAGTCASYEVAAGHPAPSKRSHYTSLSTVRDGPSIAARNRRTRPRTSVQDVAPRQLRRGFHDYFVTHLPSSSMHPDSRSAASPRHNLPRDSSSPDAAPTRSPASFTGYNREMTVVRIPLKSAKHHYGASTARGTRPYQEDTSQAGTIELPAFAKKPPMSVMDRTQRASAGEQAAEGASGDPQVFYFGVFDGHGGDTCSIWLRENLHRYIENSAEAFGVQSSLTGKQVAGDPDSSPASDSEKAETKTKSPLEVQKSLLDSWRETVGGYFKRFRPDYLPPDVGGAGKRLKASTINKNNSLSDPDTSTSSSSDHQQQATTTSSSSLESILTYSFLRADLDFITGSSTLQPTARGTSSTSPTPSSSSSEPEEEEDENDADLGRHTHHSAQPFLGGSTCSLALISTPTGTPFWHPSTPFTILTAHLGDTRILLSSTASGAPIALTPTHHPSSPGEANRLRRYAAAFTTDSFGEERISGLANTRAFGDRRSKRVGVSAEPSLILYHVSAGEFSFLTLISDGVTGVLSDQEIVDIIKESKTPEEGARNVTGLATEVGQGESGEADNATCLVVRLGGWERRSEGGVGPLGTREERQRRREGANDPRGGRR